MEREFVEYHNENGSLPYPAPTICFCLTQYAKNYVLENRKITSNIDKKVRDAVLVDSINYLGVFGCRGFILYTKNLYDENRFEEKVDSQCLLTAIINFYAYYIFEYGKDDIVKSVLRNNFANECIEEFSASDGITVLLDFINYIAEKNGYCRKFTIVDLYEKFKIKEEKIEMENFKHFLELTGKYSEKLLLGQSIDKIFESVKDEYKLKYIAEDGTYYYNDDIKNLVGKSYMFPCTVEAVEKHIYAMAYAYAKMSEVYDLKPSQNEVINQKIIEMRQK